MPSLVDCKWPLEHLEICIHVTHQFTDIPIPALGDRERVSGFHLSDTSEKRSFSSSPASLCKPISVCLNVLIILSFNSCFSGMVIKVKLRALLDSIFLGKNKDKNRKQHWSPPIGENEQLVIYPYNELLLEKKIEWASDKCYKMC